MWHVNLCHDFRYGKIMYNYFHNPENEFILKQQQSDGTEQTLNVLSFNALCLPKDSTVQLKGFDEIT